MTPSFTETRKVLSIWSDPITAEDVRHGSAMDNVLVGLMYPFTPILLPIAFVLDLIRYIQNALGGDE